MDPLFSLVILFFAEAISGSDYKFSQWANFVSDGFSLASKIHSLALRWKKVQKGVGMLVYKGETGGNYTFERFLQILLESSNPDSVVYGNGQDTNTEWGNSFHRIKIWSNFIWHNFSGVFCSSFRNGSSTYVLEFLDLDYREIFFLMCSTFRYLRVIGWLKSGGSV